MPVCGGKWFGMYEDQERVAAAVSWPNSYAVTVVQTGSKLFLSRVSTHPVGDAVLCLNTWLEIPFLYLSSISAI